MTIMKKLSISYSESGSPLTVHYNRGTQSDPMWATLPFNPATKVFEPKSKIEQILLSEAQQLDDWEHLDLSDIPLTLAEQIEPPNYQQLAASVRNTEVFGKVFQLSMSDVAINGALTFFMAALNPAVFVKADLYSALSVLHQLMTGVWNEDDIDLINTALADNGFTDFSLK